MFALRVLVAHGLYGQRLFDVVRATTVARLLHTPLFGEDLLVQGGVIA